MSKSIAYKHYIRALSRWPKDTLRPECQLQDVMRRRIEKRFSAASGSEAAALDEKKVLEEANVLYSFLENRYSRKYPITGSLMKPKSNPTHYVDLVKELEAAPQRSWLDRTLNSWKGFLRFR